MKSDVYLARVSSKNIEDRSLALKRVLSKISPFSSYRKKEIIPLKLTIGDSACVYNVSPALVKIIVSEVKKQGAKPFLFDTSVIYHGERQNAVDHLNLAQYKGFAHSRLGAPFIIADGLLGQDGREYETGSSDIPRIKVPSFVGMLDSLTVITHVTGHILSVFAGSIKNVAMGMSCRPTKQVQHSSLKPNVIAKKCTACGCCIAVCPIQAISYKPEGYGLASYKPEGDGAASDSRSHSQSHKKDKAFIDSVVCIGCGECLCACKFEAIHINWEEDTDTFCRRMADTAGCILAKFKNKFFISLALDVTKECDCISDRNEKMIAQDIGILASADILSLDAACADLALQDKKADYLRKSQGVFERMFAYAQDKGLGNREYNLIEV